MKWVQGTCWIAATNLEAWKKRLKEAKSPVSFGAAAANDDEDDDDGYIF